MSQGWISFCIKGAELVGLGTSMGGSRILRKGGSPHVPALPFLVPFPSLTLFLPLL